MKRWKKIVSVVLALSMAATMFMGLTTVHAETEEGDVGERTPFVDTAELARYPKISAGQVHAEHGKLLNLYTNMPSDYAVELTMELRESVLQYYGFPAIRIGNDILKFHPFQNEVKYQENEVGAWDTGTKVLDYNFGYVNGENNRYKVYIERKANTLKFAIRGASDEKYYYGASVPVTTEVSGTMAMQVYSFCCDTYITSCDVYSMTPFVDTAELAKYPNVFSNKDTVLADHGVWKNLYTNMPSDYAVELTMELRESVLQNYGFPAIRIGNDILKFQPFHNVVKYQENQVGNWQTGTKVLDYDFGYVTNGSSTNNVYRVYIERKANTLKFAIKGASDEKYYYGASVPVTTEVSGTMAMQVYSFCCDTYITSCDVYSMTPFVDTAELAKYPNVFSSTASVSPENGKWSDLYTDTPSDYAVELTMVLKESGLQEYGYSAIRIGNDILKFQPFHNVVKYQENQVGNWTTGTKVLDYNFGYVNGASNRYKVYIERKANTLKFAIKGASDEKYYYGASIPVTTEVPETMAMQVYSNSCWTFITSQDVYSLYSFYEDFEYGSVNWCGRIGEKMIMRDGYLENAISDRTLMSSEMMDFSPEYLWENAQIDVRLKIKNNGVNGPWAAIDLLANSETEVREVFKLLLRHGTILYGNSYSLDSDDGQKVDSFEFLPDTLYDVRIVAASRYDVYAKLATDAEYTYFGYAPRTNTDKFRIGFSVSPLMKMSVGSVKVRDLGEDELRIVTRPISMFVGDTVVIGTKYNGSNELTYTTPDEDVISVSDSTLTAKASGKTTLTISDGIYSDTVEVKVLKRAEKLTVSNNRVDFKVGEVLGITASVGDASDQRIKWTSSDESVVTVFGGVYDAKTLCAHNAGTAIVTAETLDGSELKQNIIVTVSEKNNEKGIKQTIFEDVGKKHIIEPDIYGMHLLSGNDNTTADAYTDLKIQSVRLSGTKLLKGTEESENLLNIVKNYKLSLILEDFTTASVNELVEEVKELVELTGNDALRLEMGNEVYADSSINLDRYITKCSEFYNAVKAIYPDTKIGIVILDQSLHMNSKDPNAWNNKIANFDCYDAVIPHNYDAYISINGYTEKSMMQSMYANNVAIKNSLYDFYNLFNEKEIWVTEYGYLILAQYISKYDIEMDRMCYGKSVGVALANVQKLMDMIESNVVQISAYHILFDSSGMGLMQGEGKLPGYYAYDKIGDVIKDNKYFYDIEPIFCDFANGEYLANGDSRKSAIKYPEVDVWGFGNESNLSEIVIANQTDSVKKFALKDYSLVKEWEYSAGEKPLSTEDRGFLQGNEYYNNMTEVTLPNTYTINADIIEIPPYSITVCKVAKNEVSKTIITSNIADGETDVLVDSSVMLTITGQDQINKEDFELVCDNCIVATEKQISGNVITLTPVNLLEHGRQYTVRRTITEDSSENILMFKTAEKYDWEEYTDSLETSGTFGDFVLTFDAVKVSGENIVLKIRDKTVIFKDNEVMVYPPLYTNFDCMSHISLSEGKNAKVMVVAYGPQLDFYLRTDEICRFIKIGEITNASITPSTISVSGSGISNVKIKTNSSQVTDIKYSNTVNGIKIPLAYPIGETKCEFSVNAENYNVYFASYKDNQLEHISVETNADNEYSIDLNSDSTLMQKIFIWSNDQKPLRNVITNSLR